MRSFRRMRRLVRFVTFGLVAAAIATELAKPAPERTWHVKVLGTVPYDFRPPTWRRFRDAYWNPDSERLFSDRVFGVGWAINLYRVKTLMEDAFRSMMGTPEAKSIRMTIRTEGSEGPDVVITQE